MERRVAESSAQLMAVKDELASAITERNSLRQSLSDRWKSPGMLNKSTNPWENKAGSAKKVGESQASYPELQSICREAVDKRVDSEAGARLAAAEKEVASLRELEAERCV